MLHADRLLSLAREARERAEEVLARAENFHDATPRKRCGQQPVDRCGTVKSRHSSARSRQYCGPCIDLPGLASSFIRANKDFTTAGMLDQVGGKLSRYKRGSSRVNLFKTVLPCNGGDLSSRLANSTFVVDAHENEPTCAQPSGPTECEIIKISNARW
jgi:hypothetical protein